MNQQEKQQPGVNCSPDAKTELNAPGNRRRKVEIHVQGHLSEVWEDWFEGLTIERLDNGEMVLSGFLTDQAALMGILNKIHRLNLTLLCLQETDRKK